MFANSRSNSYFTKEFKSQKIITNVDNDMSFRLFKIHSLNTQCKNYTIINKSI